MVATGKAHACAIARVDGSLFCWGGLPSGTLNQPTATPTPVVVDLGRRVVHVSAGSEVTCAVLDDTTVHCWGINDLGQLGDDTTTPRTTPAPVLAPLGVPGYLTGVHSVAVGSNGVCARRGDAGVMCWGSTTLGDGSAVASWPSLRPVVANMPQDAALVRAGDFHDVAVLASGDVACWGYNESASCATSVGMYVLSPRLVGVVGVTAAGAGWRHACVSNGAVSCWGWNGLGAVGTGSAANVAVVSPSPVVDLPTPVDALGVFWMHACARVGRDLYCWGSNQYGELGFAPEEAGQAPRAVKMSWPEGR
jgi:hypothetical protein